MTRKLYIHGMSRRSIEESDRDSAARRAVAIEGVPLVVAGTAALALGSRPATTGAGRAWWLAVSILFVLAVVLVVYRAFRRGDEYQRKIQLESMAVAFGAVLVALQVAGMLAASGIGDLRQSFQLIIIGGILLWQLVADLRTRFAS
jgi:hypothetical protein